MTADTRCLLVLPLFHVNGIMVSVVSPLLAGGSTFIAERFHTASLRSYFRTRIIRRSFGRFPRRPVDAGRQH